MCCCSADMRRDAPREFGVGVAASGVHGVGDPLRRGVGGRCTGYRHAMAGARSAARRGGGVAISHASAQRRPVVAGAAERLRIAQQPGNARRLGQRAGGHRRHRRGPRAAATEPGAERADHCRARRGRWRCRCCHGSRTDRRCTKYMRNMRSSPIGGRPRFPNLRRSRFGYLWRLISGNVCAGSILLSGVSMPAREACCRALVSGMLRNGVTHDRL